MSLDHDVVYSSLVFEVICAVFIMRKLICAKSYGAYRLSCHSTSIPFKKQTADFQPTAPHYFDFFRTLCAQNITGI